MEFIKHALILILAYVLMIGVVWVAFDWWMNPF
jgi:hypothetical protein